MKNSVITLCLLLCMTCLFCNQTMAYAESADYTTKVPDVPNISVRIRSGSSLSVTILGKKNYRVEVQISDSKNFDNVVTVTGGKSVVSVPSKSDRPQYVRARYYYSAGGTKVCSEWSAVHTVMLLDAPYINQEKAGYPNGCELMSLYMGYRYLTGGKESPDAFVSQNVNIASTVTWTGQKGVVRGADPDRYFVGNPKKHNDGWLAYPKAVKKFAQKAGLKAYNSSGHSMDELCACLNAGNTALVWATVDMAEPTRYFTYICDNKTYIIPKGSHCLLLTGYDDSYYYFNDPLAKKNTRYSKVIVNKRYTGNQKRSVVLSKK